MELSSIILIKFESEKGPMSVYTDERKRDLAILILGPYRPESALSKLEKLKSCLVKRKFLNTKLVKDFPDSPRFDEDDDIHFTKKSRWLLKHWAHVPIFVFFKNADCLGVENELNYTCLKLPNKTAYSSAFFETSLDVGSQVRGTIKLASKNQKLSHETFHNDKINDLCNLAFGHVRKMLDRLFYYI